MIRSGSIESSSHGSQVCSTHLRTPEWPRYTGSRSGKTPPRWISISGARDSRTASMSRRFEASYPLRKISTFGWDTRPVSLLISGPPSPRRAQVGDVCCAMRYRDRPRLSFAGLDIIEVDLALTGLRIQRLALCFAAGALLGTGLDALHAYGDVESYPGPTIGELGWFVPVEFGLAGVVVGVAVPALDVALAGRALAWPLAVRLREIGVIAVLYAATVAANGWGAAPLTVAFVAVLVLRLAQDAAPGDWVFALVAAVAGPVVEATLVAIGAFDYTQPDVFGIPAWLPALWANGGLVIRRVFAVLSV